VTGRYNPYGSMLSDELRWIAARSGRVEPWDSRAWKRASALFTIAMIVVGFVGSVVWELLDRRHR
jgi:hypothetical protein